MTVSFPFQQQFTWRKLGYLYFTDSLAYREVLEQNPQWKVTELPPVGAQIDISGGTPATGGLSQGNFIFGQPLDGNQLDFFPFNNEGDYVKALVKYSPSAIKNRDVVNGLSLDSEAAYLGG